jgi:hypothetical protein
MRHNKTRRGGSKTGKKNEKRLLSNGKGAFNPNNWDPFGLAQVPVQKKEPEKRVTRSMKKEAEAPKRSKTPNLLIFPSSTARSKTPPPAPVSVPRSKTRSKSKSKGDDAAAPAGDYVETQQRLLCGKHAFNNVVGQELMKMDDIFRVLRIPEKNHAKYSGNIINEDLQKIINEMDKQPRYSAFPISSLSSYQGAIDDGHIEPYNTNISAFDDIINLEKRNLNNIFTAEIFKNARGQQMAITAPMKQFIRQLYLNFLMLLKYAPDFTGLVFQVNHAGFPTGHYIAIRKLDDGKLQMIDSIGPEKSDPLPFMSDYMEVYRENCARIIMSLFEKAGLTLRMGEPGINRTPLNILVIKPRELGESHNGRFFG